ncbi:MAG TPA: sensor histidine kinase [Anaerolineales bacterium]|nr:sensor histidine kinase [Anaerolineales bacterium]
MQSPYLSLIYFFYGLAFFCMGLAILLELGHATNERLRHAFRPMAVFGFLHGIHEWIEMWELEGILPGQYSYPMLWAGIDLVILTFSFLSLAAFGVFLIARSERSQRFSLLIPLGMITIWGLGLLIISGRFPLGQDLQHVAHAWTRYVLAVPAALIASAGLIVQQREFRRAGMARFGRDSLWAAIAFLWYGLAGQTFPVESPIPPSNVINEDLFFQLFGFPVEIIRASAAILAAVFIIRVLRSFEVETRRRIADLQTAQLEEAQRREVLRGEMLRRIVAAQESERQRIARELHDETGQALTAIGLGLRGVASSIQNDGAKSSANLYQLERLVEHSLIELQRLISDLRPSHLDDLGLGATLRWYAGEIEKRLPLELSVSVSNEKTELSTEIKTTLFRIAQEALTNVIKHSAANQAKITLDYQIEGVRLEVTDDGVGFNRTTMQSTARPSWGLIGMQERASLLGGTFEINSYPGSGTRVNVYIPYGIPVEEIDDENSPVAR